MEGIGKNGILLAMMMAICELATFSAAHAEPPLKMTATLGRTPKGADLAAPKLDLRPPSEIANAEASSGGKRLFQLPFRSDGHTASPTPSGHVMSPMENLAHNFRQEGLPIAKLFQSNDSLVHVGLSPKGKPGLWIVHKLH